MIRTAGLHQPVAGHAGVVAGLYEHINGILPNPLVWTNDECHLDLMRLIGGDTATERHFLRSHYGPPCLVWLPFAEIRQLVRWAAPPQLGEQGLQRNTMASGRLVSGVIEWQHIRSGRLVIRKAHKAPGDEVRRLLLALLAHHPELAYSAKSDDKLRVTATPLDHPVVVTAKICQGPEPSVKLGITTAIGGDEMVALVSSTKEAVLAVSEYGADEVTVKRLHPHPALCRMVCLWVGKRRWIQSHKVYKQAALSATRRHDQQDIEGRHTAWHSDHSRIANALDQVSWVDIRQITGATGWGEQVLYRLKLRAFHGWDSTRSLRGCPIEECLQQDVLVAHTFWQWAGAIKLWDVFYAPWTAQGALSTPTRVTATFSLQLDGVPPDVWQLLNELHQNEDEEERGLIRHYVYDILNQCWRLGIVITLQVIWRRRCTYRDPSEDGSAVRAAAVLHGRLRAAYMTIRSFIMTEATPAQRMAAAKLCQVALTQPNLTQMGAPAPTTSAPHFILYFDGGSRGNPGPGGSGSVIVQCGGNRATPEIVWMASVSYTHRTTNNIAEYQGLLVGLRYAVLQHLHGLHVVGDSKLIITQLRTRQMPRAKHLQGVYTQCRTLADQLTVISWTHHLRHFNKMADGLANIAMDSKTSKQIFANDIERLTSPWTKVFKFLQGDIEHWVDAHLEREGINLAPTIDGAR